jgi:hypothetical protein
VTGAREFFDPKTKDLPKAASGRNQNRFSRQDAENAKKKRF